MYKLDAIVGIYLFKAEKDSVCASYQSDREYPTGGGVIGSIDSKVEVMAYDIFMNIRMALGKYRCEVTTYNRFTEEMREVEKSNPTRTPLPKELYDDITQTLSKKVWKLKIE